MKILVVINGLGTGGAERSLAELLPRFRQQGMVITIACLFQREEGVEETVRDQGFDVRIVGGKGHVDRLLLLRQLIIDVDPDLIHTTIFEADVLGRLAAVGTRIPVLSSLVNTAYEPVRQRDPNVSAFRLRVARFVDGWTARHLTSHFHAISMAVKASAVTTLRIAPELITVIPRGRDPNRLGVVTAARRQSSRARLGLRDGQPVLVSVGRQEFQKGQRYLIEAVPKLSRCFPDLVVLVAGREGHASHDLTGLVSALDVERHVRFLGHRADVPDLLIAGDIFVFPSLYEGLGGSLIEAMALGVPIVASDLPAIREVTEARAAVLVKPSDSVELADAISLLLKNPARAASLGIEGRRIYQSRFKLEQVADRMIELYHMVARPTAA